MTVKLLEYHSDKARSFCVSSCALLRPVSLWLLLESENGWVCFTIRLCTSARINSAVLACGSRAQVNYSRPLGRCDQRVFKK